MGVATTETCQFHISSGKDSASFIRQVVRVVQEIRRLLIISPEFVTRLDGDGGLSAGKPRPRMGDLSGHSFGSSLALPQQAFVISAQYRYCLRYLELAMIDNDNMGSSER